MPLVVGGIPSLGSLLRPSDLSINLPCYLVWGPVDFVRVEIIEGIRKTDVTTIGI